MKRLPEARVLWALLAIVATHLVFAGLWLSAQELPQGGRDEFFIVEAATEIAFQLSEGAGWAQVSRGIFDAYYPPLTRAPGVVALLLGGGYDAMIVAQWVVWLPLLVGGTFVIGRRLGGDTAGLVSVAVLLAAPAIADGLHRFEPNFGATAAAACVLAAWLHSDDLRDLRITGLLGLFLGLGLMSDRLGVLPFAVVPIGVSMIRTRGANWRGVGLVAIAALLVCGWWYADFLQRFANELIPQLLSGEIGAGGEELGQRPPFLWYWLHYLVLWPDTQLGPLPGFAAIGALVWAVGNTDRPELRDLLLFLAGGLLLFTFVSKRQAYYTMPLLPAVAAMVGGMVEELRASRGRAATAVTVAFVLIASLPTVLNSRPATLDLNRGIASWVLLGQSPIKEELLDQRYPLGGAPQQPGVDLAAVVGALREAGLGGDEPVAAFSYDSQVAESFLVSLTRIALRRTGVVGVCLHPEAIAEGTTPGALIVAHRGGDGWPTAELVRRSFDEYYGWDPSYEGVISGLDAMRPSATLVLQRQLTQGETLSVWRIAR